MERIKRIGAPLKNPLKLGEKFGVDRIHIAHQQRQLPERENAGFREKRGGDGRAEERGEEGKGAFSEGCVQFLSFCFLAAAGSCSVKMIGDRGSFTRLLGLIRDDDGVCAGKLERREYPRQPDVERVIDVDFFVGVAGQMPAVGPIDPDAAAAGKRRVG